jgi:hypothetical protein
VARHNIRDQDSGQFAREEDLLPERHPLDMPGPPRPQLKSAFRITGAAPASILAALRSPHHFHAMCSANALVKPTTPMWPVIAATWGAFDHALHNAMIYWQGETQFLIVGANGVFETRHEPKYLSALPGDARLYKDPVQLSMFYATDER